MLLLLMVCAYARHSVTGTSIIIWQDLEEKLKETQHLRNRIIVTDGSFSMDGTIAQLDKIVALADTIQCNCYD